MSIDFFNVKCQEPTLNADLFGLCDDQDGTKAYTNSDDPIKWIATVKNINKETIVFTAIDKCIIQDDELYGIGRCDCMLNTDNHIYFVELKDQAKGWISNAIEQLESTIQLFSTNHNIKQYKHKKAFACNKNRKHFQEIDNELNLRFFRKYGVRLDVQSEIIII